ncbi:MAG: DNA-3-methyladenine glycosylase I [Cyclobacteriaceae bacterium]|nr:DNA-3-methyladenine glycosylase I [Cyclobacteriaceae bacterium]
MKGKVIRCPWCEGFEEYINYHDEEWGRPVHDDRVHFEFIVLEGAQAGLSWSTILKKRGGYRKAFFNFDVDRVAKMRASDVNKLMKNPEIVRNRLKIESTISNAKQFILLQREFGSFDKYIWSFVDNTPVQNNFSSLKEVPASTVISDQISKDLKKRGFRFVGTTIIYAYMQACGLVNDHLKTCFLHEKVSQKVQQKRR